MRRILAVGLLLVLCFPVFSPLFASMTESESAVPVCCRKGGAHHCLGMQRSVNGRGTEVSVVAPRCADFPKAIANSHTNDLFIMAALPAFSENVTLPSVVWQAEARARVALDRARRKRGPPAVRLS